MRSPGAARRAVGAVTVATFTVAALLGVLVLVGGELGDLQVQVLLTTLLVGAASVAALCYLTTAGSPQWPVGAAGGVLLTLPVAAGLVLVWFQPQDAEGLARAFGVGAVLSASWAQVCVLVALARGGAPSVRVVQCLTLVPLAVLALVLSAMVLGADPGDGGLRVLGVAAILDVLGTVVTAVLARLAEADAAAGRPHRAGRDDVLRRPPELRAGLDREAAAQGRDPGELLDDAVRGYLRSHGSRD
ncbi:hypothetical protein [Nocardioides nanhaiensis]|uniref:Ribbon-helix-helix protein, CopG family n=1 Tax=Nocardioides nanhaiensis TaxID=1476871 RepID=A0ABP8VYJ5_9ACTN